MFEKNIMPLIEYVQESCQHWKSHPLSLMGKIAAIKTILLPKIFFVFSNALMEIPTKILNKIQGMSNRFIWGYKHARIHFSVLEQKLEHGGLALPNIRKYCCAAMMVASVGWWRPHRDSELYFWSNVKGSNLWQTVWSVIGVLEIV